MRAIYHILYAMVAGVTVKIKGPFRPPHTRAEGGQVEPVLGWLGDKDLSLPWIRTSLPIIINPFVQ